MAIRRLTFAILATMLLAGDAESAIADEFTDHQDLTYFTRADGRRALIRTVDDWSQRRSQILDGMQQVMGSLPQPMPPVPLAVQVLEEHQEAGYLRRKIAYHTDDQKLRVRAWLLIPDVASKRREVSSAQAIKHPAVLCLHQTIRQGKDSVVGLADRPTLHYAKELAQRGYVALAPDYPSFGEHKPYDFDSGGYISGTMKAIYENMRAIDVLQALPEVDAQRIGCIGHSLGGHNTLFTAAFDTRIKAAVTCCGFTCFANYKQGDLRGWSSPRYMPLVASKYKNSADLMPFDFAEVIAAIAPRAVFVVAPLHDDNFNVAGVRNTLAAASSIYKLLGHPEQLQATYPDSNHDFPDASRQAAYEFLGRTLGLQSPPQR